MKVDIRNPSNEELERLQELKDDKYEKGLQRGAFELADYYYAHGAMNAARFWARMWMLCLAISDMDYELLSRYLKGVWHDDAGNDEFVMMYG